MKRVLFLFIAIVFLSGCGSQTYTNEDTSNSPSLYTTQTSSRSTPTVQTTKDTEASSEITSEEKNVVDSDTKEITVYITEKEKSTIKTAVGIYPRARYQLAYLKRFQKAMGLVAHASLRCWKQFQRSLRKVPRQRK